MKLTTKNFGSLNGQDIDLFHMEASDGAYAEIITYGGIIHSVHVPDKNGILGDVVLGQDSIDKYSPHGMACAIIIGRYANRIVGGSFTINGKTYQLEKGADGNAMHGGSGNYSAFIFDYVDSGSCQDKAWVTLRHFDDGRGGYPGTLTLDLTYTFTEDHQLILDYNFTPTEDTPVSITNHCYFNLRGHNSGVIDDQIVRLNCDFFTPNDKTCAPTGEIRPVKGTDFDFTDGRRIGDGFISSDPQLIAFGGYDHNFCIRERGYRQAAFAYDPVSCRTLTVCTDQPGMQFYTMNNVPKVIPPSKDGAIYGKHHAFCFETQNYPNAVNFSHFPNPIYKGGASYNSRTAFCFGVLPDKK